MGGFSTASFRLLLWKLDGLETGLEWERYFVMDDVLPSRGSISIYTRARNTAGMMIKGNGPRLEASFELIHRDGFRLSSSANFIDSFLSGN